MLKQHTTNKIQLAIQHSLQRYRRIITYRNDRLFTEFLPRGYCYTTLSSVDADYYIDVNLAKFHLGMLITLLDDFADHPKHFNSILLNELYKIPFSNAQLNTTILNEKELAIVDLVKYLCHQILSHIENLPLYKPLQALFRFDLSSFYHSNHYAELMGKHATMINAHELQQLRPFNMGMVIAGMIDVFASSRFDMNELGRARHIFHLGQRYGSICNNLNTFTREWMEGDLTNEITVKALELQIIKLNDIGHIPHDVTYKKLENIFNEMQLEQQRILETLSQDNNKICSFECDKYVSGLNKLQKLHEHMQGVI